MYKYELNKIFKVTLKNISFDNIPTHKLIKLFKDGRHASHILELWIETNFEGIKKIDVKNHDFVNGKDDYMEAKNFTKHGAKFMPSRMLGVGRKYIKEEADKVIKSNIYIITDINDMPTIRVKFVKGANLLKKYPKAIIPFKLRDEFFNE
tara:strand:- start:127 stop:576 length:450 start_codon:yes stop_codon:yes gene_type:complete